MDTIMGMVFILVALGRVDTIQEEYTEFNYLVHRYDIERVIPEDWGFEKI